MAAKECGRRSGQQRRVRLTSTTALQLTSVSDPASGRAKAHGEELPAQHPSGPPLLQGTSPPSPLALGPGRRVPGTPAPGDTMARGKARPLAVDGTFTGATGEGGAASAAAAGPAGGNPGTVSGRSHVTKGTLDQSRSSGKQSCRRGRNLHPGDTAGPAQLKANSTPAGCSGKPTDAHFCLSPS